MRKIVAILLCALMLTVPVQAREEKYVALTFDDGPSGRFTRRLLDGLEKRDARATFLLCGYRVRQYPEETLRIFEDGHEIGIHGYSHDTMCRMSVSQIRQEIRDTAALLPDGCVPVFLRPPGGLCSDALERAADREGLAILHWSLDPEDWAVHSPGEVVRRVLSQVRDGDVILLHDMSDSSVDAALGIIDELTARGFQFVTVSELARIRELKIVPGKTYRRME